MENNTMNQVCSKVYSQFPELRGVGPAVKAIPGDKFQLIFHGKSATANGKSLPRTVRVVADANGRILKLTTSR